MYVTYAILVYYLFTYVHITSKAVEIYNSEPEDLRFPIKLTISEFKI